MPDKWPLANGNWSTAANWNAGTVPVDGDTVYADNRTVTMDVDVNQPNTTLLTTQRSGGTAGGTFTASTARTFSFNSLTCGSTVVLTLTGTGIDYTLTLAGTATASASANASAVNISAIGQHTFNGGTYVGGNSASRNGISASGAGSTIIFNGVTSRGGTNASAYGISVTGNSVTASGTLHLQNNGSSLAPAIFCSGTSCVFNLSGNVNHQGATQTAFIGGVGTTFNYTVLSQTSSGTMTVSSSAGLWGFNAANMSVVVDASALSRFTLPASGNFLYVSGSGSVVTYKGDLKLTTNGGNGFVTNTTGKIVHFGDLQGADSLLGSGAAYLNIGGTDCIILDSISPGTAGHLPLIYPHCRFKSTSELTTWNEAGSPLTFVEAGSAGDYPDESDVRDGVAYGFATLEGTCAVPSSASVFSGVPVDNTVGSATISATSIRSAVGLGSANLDTQLNAIPAIKAQTDKLTFDGANNVATITRLMSQAALSQFATDNTGQTSAADGSVAKLSQGGSGGGGDATLDKQNEILAAIGTAAVVHAPVITSSLIEVTEGITYDGTFLPKLYWTVTTNYQTADSINLKVWRQEEDGTRTLMKSATATATSATNIEITSFTASFLAALRYQGTPAFDRLQFCLYATEGSNDYEIASGDFHVKERRTS